MATMSNLNKSVKLTNFSLSTDREGGKLKVVVGSYSVSGTTGTYVFYTSVLTPDQLNTMAGNFSLTADKSGSGTALGNKAILPHSTYSNTLTVKEPEPKRIIFNLNGKKINNYSMSGETVTYNQDDYGKTLSQGSFSMSSVGGATHAVTATPGHTITFTANLNAGYQLKSFTVTGASGSAVSVTKENDTNYTFVMPNEEVTVSATVRKSSSIMVVQPESGSITVTVPDMTMVGDKFTDVEDGTTVTLSATGDDFGKWSITNAGGTDVTSRLMYSATSKDTSFTMPPYDITITAKVKHDITVNATGGTYMVVKSTNTSTAITKAVVGDKIWVDLTPNTNYKLTGVEIKDAGGETVSYRTYYNKAWHSDASLLESGCRVEYYMPDKAVTIDVTFELDACAITTDIKNGTISGITSPAAIGSDVSFTLAPTDDTYKLDSYKVFKTGDEATTVGVTENNGTYTFTMPDYPVTVSATFVKKTHAVTVEIQGETAGGAVSINKTSPVTVGEEVQVTVDTNANYVLASLTMNDTNIMSSKSFTMPNKAVTIKAVFEKTKHRLEYVQSLNGTIQEITASDALPWGTVLHFTVTPNPYYVIDYVAASINGVLTKIQPYEEGKYTYTTTPAYTTIKAYYKKQQFTVKASTTTNGTITLGKPATLDWGENFTINVTAAPHYEIDSVTVDGKTVTVNRQGNYTFEMPKHDVTVSATFKKIKYTITGEGNNVTFGIPDKSTYNWGDTVEITATPDQWYNIKNVYAKTGTTEITEVSGKENTYSFTMPASDITIVAVAERPNFTVTFDSQGGSDIIPATVANGAALTKPAAPSWAGRGFAGWYTDADCTQKYDFTKPVIRDLTLYARWFLWGDVNGDGKVNSNDALLIQRCRVGLTDYSYIKNKFAGLVSQLGDGTKYPVSRDALLIQRYRVGLITRFTVEDTAAGYEFDLEHEIIISPNA